MTYCLLIADANKLCFSRGVGRYHNTEGELCSALHARKARLRIQVLRGALDLLGISLIEQGAVQRVTFVTIRREREKKKRISIESASRGLGPPDCRIFRCVQSSADFIVFIYDECVKCRNASLPQRYTDMCEADC